MALSLQIDGEVRDKLLVTKFAAPQFERLDRNSCIAIEPISPIADYFATLCSMGFYDEEKTARQYITMADGYDGSELIATLSKHVPRGGSVLEIGMGPGKDLDILDQNYRVTGSDSSRFFVDLYQQAQPDADLLILDAVTLDTDRKFDCIYSNKVLHHLNEDDLQRSLERQHQLLNDGGHVMHSFWKGDRVEEMHGLKFFYRTEAQLRSSFEKLYDLISMAAYEELEPDDSIFVLAQRSS